MKKVKSYLLTIVVILFLNSPFFLFAQEQNALLPIKKKIVGNILRFAKEDKKTAESLEDILGDLKTAKDSDHKRIFQQRVDKVIEAFYPGMNLNHRTFYRSKAKVLADANDRIQKLRTASVLLTVKDRSGNPLKNAKIEVKQLQHKFLFGTYFSWPMWAAIAENKAGVSFARSSLQDGPFTARDVDISSARFLEFANYTALPVNWNLYEPRPGKLRTERYRKTADWLNENGVKVRTVGLIWNSTNPAWLPNNCTSLMNAMEGRIRHFLTVFNGKFDYFAILNEAANPFRSHFAKDKLTHCYRELGHIPVARKVFEIARNANPSAKLMINETIHAPVSKFPILLQSLKSFGDTYLFDVIGLQAHMHYQLWPIEYLWNLCEFYAYFNAPIHFTEVTVLSGTPNTGKRFGRQTTQEGELMQRDYVVDLYTALFSHPAVAAIQWWSFTDKKAWQGAPAGLLRKDMTPKPAYKALMDLIKNKWWTDIQLMTDKAGQCRFRAFLGEHEITVYRNGHPLKIFELSISKPHDLEYLIEI